MRKLLTVFLSIVIIFNFPMTATSQDNDTWISDTAYEACVEYGEEYGICPELIMSVIESESWGVRYVENNGCVGLMQIHEKYHRDRMKRLGVTDLYNERQNILVGTDYLRELFEEYGETATVLMIYNGTTNAITRAENGKLTKYAVKILERSAQLEEIHERKEGLNVRQSILVWIIYGNHYRCCAYDSACIYNQ